VESVVHTGGGLALADPPRQARLCARSPAAANRPTGAARLLPTRVVR